MRIADLSARIVVRTGLFMAALTFFGACAPSNKGGPVMASSGGQPGRANDGISSGGAGSPTTSTPGTAGGSAPQRGTTDGGGGNGLKGRVFESYIVEPTKLRGFKEFIQPIIDHLDSTYPPDPPNVIPSSGTKTSLMIWFQFKKWYLLPLTLRCADKETLGISFALDSDDQLACQNRREVWIDSVKTKYDSDTTGPKKRKADREFARLAFHEWIMQLYLMKFEKMSEVIKLFAEATSQKIEQDMVVEQMDKILPPEPARPLNKDDYAIIRRVTDYIFENGTQMTYDQFSQMLKINGFDTRLIGENESKLDVMPEEIKSVTKEDVIRLLQNQERIGNVVKECRTPEGDLIAECKMKLEVQEENKYGGLLKFTIESQGKSYEYFGSVFSEQSLTQTATTTKKFYQLSLSPLPAGAKFKTGDSLKIVSLEFRPTQKFSNSKLDLSQRLELDRVQISQYSVVNSVRKKGELSVEENCVSVVLKKSEDPFGKNYSASVQRDSKQPSFNLLVDFYNEPICFPDLSTLNSDTDRKKE